MQRNPVKPPNCCAVITKLPAGCLTARQCFLVQMAYGDSDRPRSVTRHDSAALPVFNEHWIVRPDHAEALEKARCYVAEIVWKAGELDDLLIDVAEDKTDPLLFAAADTGRVYSPYDGGADLFLEDKRTRDDFEEELKDITDRWKTDGN